MTAGFLCGLCANAVRKSVKNADCSAVLIISILLLEYIMVKSKDGIRFHNSRLRLMEWHINEPQNGVCLSYFFTSLVSFRTTLYTSGAHLL